MRRKHELSFALRLLVLAGLVLQGGCGYRFAADSSLLPKDARTIFIEPFVNRSRDVGLEKELASAMRGEFYRRGPLRVVDQSDLADVIVSGVIRPLENTVASVNGFDEALQYLSAMTVDMSLRQREPNVVLWRGDAIRLNEYYAGSRAAVVPTSSEFRTGTLNTSDVQRLTDIQLTEAERKDTRNQLMERFAKELYQRVMEMF
ncbi:MAG TPA: LPS assembly lipoprotein LptE [Candidatus Binatia bacterium]